MVSGESVEPVVILRFLILILFTAVASADSFAQHATCNITVTITDQSGAVIQDAFVVLKADRTRTTESFELEARTNAAGSVKTSLPCGLIDIFATANGFTPFAQKLTIGDETHTVSIPLKVYPRKDIQRVQ
jgi:hypothetical protein